MEINISVNQRLQKFEGWGTALCWWAHIVGQWKNEKLVDELCDLIFDVEKGLGLNIIRYNFGAGDNPPNMEYLRSGANIPSNGISEGQWDMSLDLGQRKILQKAMEKGPMIKEGFFNSPPLWLTKSGSSAGAKYGENNLSEENESTFVDYMVTLLNKFAEVYDIKFETLSPFNEPSSTWWTAKNNQEGCHYSVSSQERILAYLQDALHNRNLYDIDISGPEGWSTHETISMYNDYDELTKKCIKQINSHTYFTDERSKRLLHEIANRDNKKLWMSEVCYASNNEHNHDDVETGLIIAKAIIDDLKQLKPEAWIYWQVVEDENLKHNYGFIHAPFIGDEEFAITKSYYYLAQFTKFVRPGMIMLKVEDDHIIGAYDEKKKQIVIVILNSKKIKKEYEITLKSKIYSSQMYSTSSKINLQKLKCESEENVLSIECPSESVSTISLQI